MTIKELSELLDVTKNTINNKVRKLHIEPIKKGNKFELKDEDAEKIIKNLYPSNFQEYFDKANLGKTETAENVKNTQNDKITNNNDSYNDKNDNQTTKNDNNNAQYDTQTAQINERLISMLEKSLADKEDTIKAQQKQIEMLLTTNAALTAKVTMLEDKSQERQQDIVVNEQSAAAPTPSEQTTEQEQPQKESWWKRLFK